MEFFSQKKTIAVLWFLLAENLYIFISGALNICRRFKFITSVIMARQTRYCNGAGYFPCLPFLHRSYPSWFFSVGVFPAGLFPASCFSPSGDFVAMSFPLLVFLPGNLSIFNEPKMIWPSLTLSNQTLPNQTNPN